MTDPTPAATARDALIEKCADAVWNAGHYTFGDDLDNLIALAAAEAPGRVAALRGGLAEMMTLAGFLQSCVLSGESLSDADRVRVAACFDAARSLLASPAPTTRLIGPWSSAHVGPERPAPTPAPSEPVARWTLVPGEDDDCPRCGRAKVRIIQPEYEPGGALCDECGWDSRDTPGARDE